MTHDKQNKTAGRFRYVLGIVGGVVLPENDWSDQQLEILKDMGVNTLQLNIAWGWRPGGEVLNLEDIDDYWRDQFRFRIQQARKYEMETMLHVGIPRMEKEEYDNANVKPVCILDPAVHGKYVRLVTEFFTEFAYVNHLLVYNYDQQAWLCSELGDCPRCGSVPVHERLKLFLDEIKAAMQRAKPGSVLWWHPWELSAGQTYKTVQVVDPQHVGPMLNNTIGEVCYQNRSDLWLRNLTQLAAERGIPVIGEIACSGWGIGAASNHKTPCPRLIYQQAQAIAELRGMVGIKEHFGIVTSEYGVNEALFKAYLKAPDATLEEPLVATAEPYGKKAAPLLMDAWEQTAQGMEFIPFDCNYAYPPLYMKHDWEPAWIRGGCWDTSSWKSNRRAFFMLTEPTTEPHPWLYEDVGLRLDEAAARLFAAVRLYEQILETPRLRQREEVEPQRDAVLELGRGARGRALHILETLAANPSSTVGP